MKVALVHDFLVNYGGAETVLELFLRMFPRADIYTFVYDKKKMKGRFEGSRIFTSGFSALPFASKLYTKALKFMPDAFESFDFSSYDLVISSSSCCAKGVITPPGVPHIAYVHSPMRYAWDLYFDYKAKSSAVTRFFMDLWMPSLRLWDYVSSQRIDTIVANSAYIARRIYKYWRREAVVIHPPLNEKRFYADMNVAREDFYVTFSRLVPYKKVDLAIKAIKGTGRKLYVIGDGSERKKLEEMASGDKNIIFTGRADDEEVRSLLQRARALIFPPEEDFGITPLEAESAGSPVIAFARGGSRETVVDGKTGLFFEEQTAECLKKAIERFEKMDESKAFNHGAIINHAKTFSEEKFIAQFSETVEKTVSSVRGGK